MIRKVFKVKDKWEVVVYYNIDYNLFDYIANDISKLGINDNSINRLYKMMYTHKAKAFTISSPVKKCSIVGINTSNSRLDFINSIAHEATHVAEAMMNYYGVKLEGEPIAYTIGYLVQIMIEPLKFIY